MNLLVTGASGQLGQRVLELLLKKEAGTIIAVTRSPEKLGDFAEKGVIVRYGNFDEPESLKKAFADADRLLLISTDALGESGKRLNQHTVAVQAADKVGVSHIIYTSIVSADDSPILFAPDHAGTEEAIANTSMGYTILRNNLYMDLLLSSVPQAYQLGGLFSATGDGKTSYITREDCAQVAAVALADTFYGKRKLDITGPEALSQTEVAEIASSITGKTLSHIPVPLEAVIEGMVGAGLPRPVADTYASIDIAIEEGKLDTVSSAYQDLTGTKPTAVRDFLKANESVFDEVITS